MNRKHQKTLKAVFRNPVSGTIPWTDIESLLASLGGEIKEGRGSRVRIIFPDHALAATFHRPHPEKETDKGAVKSVRRLLTELGVGP